MNGFEKEKRHFKMSGVTCDGDTGPERVVVILQIESNLNIIFLYKIVNIIMTNNKRFLEVISFHKF